MKVRERGVWFRGCLALTGAIVLATCTPRNVSHDLREVSSLDRTEPLRVHAADGSLVVFSSWRFRRNRGVSGTGVRYDAARAVTQRGAVEVPVGDITLVETTESSLGLLGGSIVAMSVVTAASVAVTTACASCPKCCFGSCPTFYAPAGDGWTLQAEGFSTSIARSLEASDTDDLPAARPDPDGYLRLEVRNEAQETHFLREATLLVVDAPPGSEAYRAEDGALHAVSALRPAAGSDTDEDTLRKLSARDGDEWSPGTDGQDLARRTRAVLRFSSPGSQRAGLVLTARNSLMNTWVFYHLLARLGREAGAFIAHLERRDPAAHGALEGYRRALGGIDVETRQGAGPWVPQGTFAYQGPLAQGTRVVPLSLRAGTDPVEVRLTFAGAHWRLDSAQLGALTAEGLSARAVAVEVERPGRQGASAAEASLRGQGERLVTLPGDALGLRFHTGPHAPGRAYFLRTRGYYYEWLRERWLADEDLPDARALLADPSGALRRLAPSWAETAPTMEALFWQSRVGPGRRP
ncbi:MAG: hypothetical protein HY909_01795 [Deltaproteobacteria bacterium]|nr:hypothetical protein [Deltaproteobacteria bacterium]